MSKPQRTLKLIIVVLSIAILGGYFLFRNVSRSAIPDYKADIQIEGLQDEVRVLRDKYAVPHIYAENEHDLYMATGYIMAQDRLWQMDLLRRVTQGRLSEIFGEDMVKTDLLLRSLKMGEKSRMMLSDCNSEQCDNMQAFADGVNRYLEDNASKLPPEFIILQYEPEKWEPEHTLNVVGYISWDLSAGNLSMDLMLHKLVSKFGEERAKLLLPDYKNRKDVIYPGFQLDDELLESGNILAEADRKLDEIGARAFFGSNNWVVSGEKSVNGMPILANDMHLSLNAPGIWYQIHQVVEGKLNVTGLAIPGAPLVIAGHNDSIAWGMTNIMMDDLDLYLEQINPGNKDQYMFNGEWKDMDVREEIVYIKGGDSVITANRFTHRGPIISEVKDLDEQISMKWIGYDYGNACNTVYMLDRADNIEDFKDALRTFRAVSQNVVYADKKGNIALYAGGAIPIREGEGYLVKPGDTDKYDWKGIVPFEENPHEFNPERGYLASANNKTVDDSYPYYISSRFAQGHRYRRIVEMLEEKEKLSADDFAEIQGDHHSDMAKHFLPDILSSVNRTMLSEQAGEAISLLDEWDYEYSVNSTAALIFENLYLKLCRHILQDEMGEELYNEFEGKGYLVDIFMHNFWENKESAWCDNLDTDDKKECFKGIVTDSYIDVIKDLTESSGKNQKNWKWGDVHKFTMAHPLGKVKMLDRLFNLNRGPFPVGGSGKTVSPYSYKYPNTGNVDHGASHRHIFTISDWDMSLTVIPTGQSGIPASRHYLDQLKMYLRNEYHADPFSSNEVKESAKYTGRFLPAEE